MGLTARFSERRALALSEGTSMLEMAIVLPFLLLLIFSMVEFGIMFGRYLVVNNAAREGARTAIVYRNDCDLTTVENEVVATVQGYSAALGLAIPASDINSTGLCTGAGSASTVTVTLPFTFQVLPGIAPSIGPTIDLSSASVMRNEG